VLESAAYPSNPCWHVPCHDPLEMADRSISTPPIPYLEFRSPHSIEDLQTISLADCKSIFVHLHLTKSTSTLVHNDHSILETMPNSRKHGVLYFPSTEGRGRSKVDRCGEAPFYPTLPFPPSRCNIRAPLFCSPHWWHERSKPASMSSKVRPNLMCAPLRIYGIV
jgi:hypothetical protein